MTFALVFGFLAVFSLALGLLAKRTAVALLPFVIFGASVFLYAAALIKKLHWGVLALAIAVALALVLALVFKFRESIDYLKTNLSSPAFVLFGAYSAVTFVLTRQAQFASYDEFTHWGRAIKATFVYDRLAQNTATQLDFSAYPPMSQMFEYFVAKLGGGWLEGNVFWAYQLVIGAVIFSLIVGLKWRNPGKLLVAVAALIIIPGLLFNPFTYIYVDAQVAMVFGYLLVVAYSHKPADWVSVATLSLGLGYLLLLKESAMILAITVLLVFIIRNLSFVRQSFKSRTGAALWLLTLVLPIASVVYAYQSWQVLLRRLAIEKTDWPTPFSWSALNAGLTGTGPKYWNTTSRNFIEAFFTKDISQYDIFGATNAGLAALTLGVLVWAAFRQKPRAVNLWIAGVITFVGLAYNFGLLVLYWFRFSEIEALGLAAYARYMGSFWQGILVLLLVLWLRLPIIAEPVAKSRWALKSGPTYISIALILAVTFGPAVELVRRAVNFSQTSATMRAKYDYLENVSIPLKRQDDAHILVIDAANKTQLHTAWWVAKYFFLTSKVNGGDAIGNPEFSAQAKERGVTPTEYFNYILGHVNFIALTTITPEFKGLFSDNFVNPEDIADGTFYRVVTGSEGRHKLVLMTK